MQPRGIKVTWINAGSKDDAAFCPYADDEKGLFAIGRQLTTWKPGWRNSGLASVNEGRSQHKSNSRLSIGPFCTWCLSLMAGKLEDGLQSLAQCRLLSQHVVIVLSKPVSFIAYVLQQPQGECVATQA